MLPRRIAWSVALLGTLTMVISYIDRQTLAVIAPKVTEELGITETQYGWLASAFSIAYLLAAPIAGWWIDRTGARRGLVTSVLVWSGIAAMHALVPNFAVLFALRIALGIAESPSFPGSAQTVQRMLPLASRPRGYSLLFMGSSIGAMIVPPLAARLAAAYSWRIACVATAVIAMTWVPLWLLVTSRPRIKEELDRVPVATKVRPPLIDLLRDKVIIRGVIAVFSAAPVAGLVMIWGSKYLVRSFHMDQKFVGDYLWFPPLCLDLGALLFGDLAVRTRSDTNHPPRALYATAMILAASLVLLPYATTPWEAMFVFGSAVAGSGALYTLCTADMLARMPPSIVAASSGFLVGSQSLALVIMGPLVGAAVDHFQSYSQVGIFIGLWALPGSLIWILWRPRSFALQV
jgi:MFS transporter, ACS family, hexuronate transporter